MAEYVRIRGMMASDKSFLEFVTSTIAKPNEPNADLLCILLANIAKDNAIATIFQIQQEANKNDEIQSSKVLDQLMDCFVKGSDKSLNKHASFDYLAFAFADISRLVEGRRYFTSEQAYDGAIPLTKIMVFTEHKNQIRRAGAASVIKNSLFEVPVHMRLLDRSTVNLLPYILLPLAGPEELKEDEMLELPDELQLLPPDKEREPDHEILAIHLESLILLTTSREGRDFLRDTGVYPLIRELHLAVDNDAVQETAERLVQVIMGDEADVKPANQRLQLLPAEEEEETALVAL
ncbi:uncharacterized protein V1510DRAFT_412137 [Dipodascopsis tothii]|uniref:uncharacterized protein n=1 Tax=Dipodascopsis tothii TaxID=44089 RepID=UPI0034CFF3CD